MHIAIVSIGSFDTHYSDYHIMRDIIIGFLDKGYSVNLVQKQYLNVPIYPGEFKKYLSHGLQVNNIPFERKNKSNLSARYIADLIYYFRACLYLRELKPDVIFLQSNNTAFLPVFFAKNFLNCPLIYNEQDIFPENAFFANILTKTSIIFKVTHFLQRYAYKNSTLLSTISNDMKYTIMRRYGISESKIEVIHNWGHDGIKLHSKEENAFLKKYPKKTGEFRVIYAGNLGKMQNVELILSTAEIMKEKQDIVFYIIGNGVSEKKLKAFAKDKELTNVIFLDMQPQDEVADLYSAADVNLIPLQKGIIYAALPSKTADCLIAGRPIITCVDKNSSFARLINKYGYRNCDPQNAEELKNIILRERELAHCDNRSTKQILDLFSKEKGVSMHCQCIDKVLNLKS